MAAKRVGRNVLQSICDSIEQNFAGREISFAEQGLFKDEMLMLLSTDTASLRKVKISEARRNAALTRRAVMANSNDSRQLLRKYLAVDKGLDRLINKKKIEVEGVEKPKSLLDDPVYQKPPRKKRKLKTA